MKELIDYFNEHYTKKAECILKDAEASFMEMDDMRDIIHGGTDVSPKERTLIPYWKIDMEYPEEIYIEITAYSDGDVLNISEMAYKEINKNGTVHYIDREGGIFACKDGFIFAAEIAADRVILSIYKNYISLPKIEYPKTKKDIYRAFSFISTVSYQLYDEYLADLVSSEFDKLPIPQSIDEVNMYIDCKPRNSSVHKVTNKDNYYTLEKAIKEGKTLVYPDGWNLSWKMNEGEKCIHIERYGIFTEDGFLPELG